ncbi:methyltransferase domain-containing protein [Knoellia koreensis]|uniref:methyltransferase domain-containing protein n=1 Tax=Knoellia koreensis TaxID=2730921 RepID=UPI00197EC47D
MGSVEGAYDAVFDFAIIHHVEDWRSAQDETARVLRHGGLSCSTRSPQRRWPHARTGPDHPKHDRFTAEDFLDAPSNGA